MLLSLLLEDGKRQGMAPIIGGDFNASIGELQEGDDADMLRPCGCGVRNARGQTLVRWLSEHGLQVLSRQPDARHAPDSWTCLRAFDGSRVQIDFLCADVSFEFVHSWCDNALAVGLDH
eukprot:1662474-Pyramimonas_sp.AAC.1